MRYLFLFVCLVVLSNACIPYNRDPELDATLEKLYVANEQLHTSIGFYRTQASQIIDRMQEIGNQHPNDSLVLNCLLKAKKSYEATTELVKTFDQISTRIVELSGGYNEHGRLVGGLDHAYHEDYTIGNASKEGVAYSLAEQLRSYEQFLKTMTPDIPIPNIMALNAESDVSDFAHFHFKDTPTITCLLTLASIEWEIARNEHELMLFLAKQIAH